MSEISSQDEKEIFAKYMLKGYEATRKYIIKNFYKENTEFIENTISDKIQFTKSVLDKIFNKPEKLNDFLNSPSTPKREYILNEDGKLNLERTSNDTQTKNEFTKQIFGAYTPLNKRIDEEYISDFSNKVSLMIQHVLKEHDIEVSGKVSAGQRQSELQSENDKIKEILNLFVDSDGKSVNYKKVFENMTQKIDVVNFKQGKDIDKKDIDKHMDFINLLEPHKKTPMQPIYEQLKIYNSNDNKKMFLPINDMVGTLDSRKASNRAAIYQYWEEVNKDYKVFQNKFKAFKTEIDNTGIEKFTGETKNIIIKLLEFNENIVSNELDNNLNYVSSFEAKELDDFMKHEKHLVLFEGILNNKKLLPLIKDEFEPDEQHYESVAQFDDEGNIVSDTAEVEGGKKGAELPKKDIIVLGKTLSDMRKIKVDPLYYLEFKNKAFKDPTPVLFDEMETLERLLLNESDKYHSVMDVDIEPLILQYVKKLNRTASVLNESEYYLPLSKTTISTLFMGKMDNQGKEGRVENADEYVETPITEVGKIKIKTDKIAEFLITFSKLYDTGVVAPTKTTDKYRKKKTEDGGLISPLLENLGSIGDDEIMIEGKQLKNLDKTFKALLEIINEYFVTPINSRYSPFEDSLSLDTGDNNLTRVFGILSGATKRKTLENYMSDETLKLGYSKFKPRHIKRVTNYLNKINTPNKNITMAKIIDLMNEGINLVKLIADLDKNDKILLTDANEEFGTHLYNILDNYGRLEEYFEYHSKSNINPEGYFPNADSKKTPENWHDGSSKSKRKNYPFYMIVKEIHNHRESIEQSFSGSKQKNANIIINFVQALDEFKNSESTMEYKMLKAHDNIRKMLGKPIYYNTSKLDNFDHTNAAIEIMKNDYNVDVTAHEIYLIVNEINSLGEISVKHGVPKESVYFLKANFR